MLDESVANDNRLLANRPPPPNDSYLANNNHNNTLHDELDGRPRSNQSTKLQSLLTLTFDYLSLILSAWRAIGNKSVPIQLAQCWFPGLAISNAII